MLKGKITIRLIALVMCVFVLFGSVGCGNMAPQDTEHNHETECVHNWKDATCTEPKTCTLCGQKQGEALGHNGGTSTCKSKAVCATCGEEYGELAAHKPSGVATETEASVCTVCGFVIAPATGHIHSAKNEWSKDENGHWHACNGCDTEKLDSAAHVYTNDCDSTCDTCGYERNAVHTGGTATCNKKAVCTACGVEYGTFAAHDYDTSKWGYSDANGHAHACKYEGCIEHDTVVAHTSSGAATENEPSTCTVCGYILAPALDHTTHTAKPEWEKDADNHWHGCVGCSTEKLDKAAHVYDNDCDKDCNTCGYMRINVTHDYTKLNKDNTTHWYECSVCGSRKPDSEENHKGGVANCTSGKLCDVCQHEYDDKAPDAHTSTEFVYSANDDGTHQKKHACCGVIINTKEYCSGGTATCQVKAKCEHCSAEYGSLGEHTGGNASCTAQARCGVCGQLYGGLGVHVYNVDKVDAAYLASPAACDAKATYYYSCACGVRGTETFSHGEALGHDWTAWVFNNNTHTRICRNNSTHTETLACGGGAPTCEAPAICATCQHEYSPALGHKYTNFVTVTEATCTTKGLEKAVCDNGCGSEKTQEIAITAHEHEENVVTPTCDEGGYTEHVCKYCGDKYVDAETPAAGHDWDKEGLLCGQSRKCAACGHTESREHDCEEVSSTNATCTSPAIKRYECKRVDCTYSYEEIGDKALGHDIDGVEPTLVPTDKSCEFIQSYKCDRNGCEESVEGKTVTTHKYTSVITQEATCKTEGTKKVTCTVEGCDYEEEETISVDTVNGHTWDEGTPDGTKTVYTCTNGCGATKSTVNVTKDDKIPVSEIGDTELKVNNDSGENVANMQLGSANITSTQISVSANAYDISEYEDQLGDLMNQISSNVTNKIYDFSMTDENGDPVDFGKDGLVTVTIPYTPNGTENMENIAVWFLGEDGTVEAKGATYSNGYITFQTEHFSRYTVTELTPEQRCKTYGHQFRYTTVDPTCLTKGYTLEYCIRCGLSQKTNEVAALGHSYELDEASSTGATCTATGSSTYKCANCTSKYTIISPSTGHQMEETDNVPATCTTAGYVVEKCATCGFEAKTVTLKKGHAYTNHTIEATCVTAGYTEYTCSTCEHKYRDGFENPKGHSYSTPEFVWSEDYSSVTFILSCSNGCELAESITITEGIIVKDIAPTCTTSGMTEYSVYITYNGEVYSDVQTKAYADPSFNHTMDNAWKYDGENHWHECLLCDEKQDSAAHVFGDGIVVLRPTCSDSGTMSYACACGYVKTEEISALGNHNYDGATLSYDDNGHWYACILCGTAGEVSEHTLTQTGETAPTCSVAGSKTHACECGYTTTEAIPATGDHNFTGATLKQDDNGHWYECVDCKAVGKVSEHDLAKTDATAPTCTEAGSETYTCICGYTKTVTVPATGVHVYENGTCKHCGKAEGTCTHEEFAEKKIDLSAYGMCMLEITVMSCECGEVVTVEDQGAFDFCDWDEIGEWEDGKLADGTEYEKGAMKCDMCGAVVELVMTYTQDGCSYTQTTQIKYIAPDGTLIFENVSMSYTGESHENSESFTDRLSEDCGGEYHGYTCKDCGYTYIYWYDSNCDLGEPVLTTYTDENGVEHTVSTRECAKCGFKYVADTYEVVISVCETKVYCATSVISGDKVMFTVNDYDVADTHEWKVETEFLGVTENCEDGCRVNASCDKCGETYKFITYDHSSELKHFDLTENGACGGYVDAYVCEFCGIATRIESLEFGCKEGEKHLDKFTDDNGNEHIWQSISCPTCGLYMYMEMWTEKEGTCTVNDYQKLIVKNDTPILEALQKDRMAKHNYGDPVVEKNGETCEDGYTITQTCTDCGDVMSGATSGCYYQTERFDLSEYGVACGGSVESNKCVGCGKTNYAKESFNCVFGKHDMSSNKVTCEECGTTFERQFTASEVNDKCEYTETRITKIYVDGAVVLEYSEAKYGVKHSYKYEVVSTVSGNCKDGITIRVYCENCGYERTEEHYGCYTEYTRYDLAELGIECGGFVEINKCVACGQTQGVYESFGCDFGYVDVLPDEGGDDKYPVETDADKYPEATETIPNGDAVDTMRPPVMIETMPPAIKPIFDDFAGVITDVAYPETKVEYTETEEIYPDTKEDYIETEGDYADTSKPEDGDYGEYIPPVADAEHERVCVKCGTVWERINSITEKDENCKITESTKNTFYVDGVTVLEYSTERYSWRHNNQYEFTPEGESCEDGYKITAVCADCGMTSDYGYGNSHYSYRKNDYTLDNEANGFCNWHYVNVSTCPCGEYVYVDHNMKSEGNGEYACPDCLLRFVDITNTNGSGCEYTATRDIKIYSGETELYSKQNVRTYTEHTVVLSASKDADGNMTVTAVCSVCGLESSVAPENAELVLNEETNEYYYDLVVTPEVSGEYVIYSMASRDTYVELYRIENGEYICIDSNDDGGNNGNFKMWSYLEVGCTYVYRISSWKSMEGITIPYVFSTVGDEVACLHNTREYYTLPDGVASCEDGLVHADICTKCMFIENIGQINEHRESYEYKHFSDYGACYGHIEERTCHCGQYNSMWYDVGCYNDYSTDSKVGEDGKEHYIETYTCDSCSKVVVVDMYSLVDGCKIVKYTNIKVYMNGELIIDFSGSSTDYDHSYEFIYVFDNAEGESNCENGVTVIWTCKGCGDSYEEHYDWHIEIDKRHEFSDYGACYGYINEYTCPCGYMSKLDYYQGCYDESNSQNITDEKGVEHRIRTYTCNTCGKVVIIDRYNVKKENSCEYITYIKIDVLMNGASVISYLGTHGGGIEHDYDYSVEMYGKSCEDGYKLTATCKTCGEVGEERECYGHYDYRKTHLSLNNAENSFCDWHYVYISTCPCGESTNVDHNLSFDENGVYACEECSLIATDLTTTVENGCEVTATREFKIYSGETELYAWSADSTYAEHKIELSASMDADGNMTVTTVCSVCGLTASVAPENAELVLNEETKEYYYDLVVTPEVSGEYVIYSMASRDTYVELYRIENGEYICIDSNDDGGNNGNFWLYSYLEVGYTYVYRIRFYNSTNNGTIPYVLTIANAESSCSHNTQEYYALIDGVTSCEDGLVRAYICSHCGNITAFAVLNEHHNDYEYHYFANNGACFGEMGISRCLCGELDSMWYNVGCYDSYESETVLGEDGIEHNVERYTCSTCGKLVVVDTYTVQEGCAKVTYAKIDVSINGENIVYVNSVYGKSYSHNYEYSYVCDDTEGEPNCENGVTVTATCVDCRDSYSYHTWSHETVVKESYDLADYNACGGYFRYYECACGKYGRADYSFNCSYRTSSDSYIGEDGNLHNTYAITCETCGLRYDRDYYTVRDAATCKEVTYYRVSVSVGATLVTVVNYEESRTSHQYSVSGVLKEGATTCDEGITITYTCVDCGYSYYNNYSGYHCMIEVERYDLTATENGASAHRGYAVVTRCPCGANSDIQLADYMCEFDSTYVDCWVDGRLSGWIYTADNSGGYHIGHNAYIMTCAVTDPQCAYSIRRTTYWLPVDGECKAVQYEVWQLGYNPADGSYSYEIKIETGSTTVYHPYVSTSLSENYENGNRKVSGTRYDCPDCRSYYYQVSNYSESGNCTSEDRYYENKLDNGNRKSYREYREYDSNGSTSLERYTSVEADGTETWNQTQYIRDNTYTTTLNGEECTGYYYKTIHTNSNGEEWYEEYAYAYYKNYSYYIFEMNTQSNGYWSRYDYTYNFDGTCERTITYTNSNGEINISEETCHHTYNVYDLDSTCTQVGYYSEHCYVCEKPLRENIERSPHGHNWYYISENLYYCTRCGMENTNGADGDIVLEDLTEKYGNGENYVVGYWARNNVQFEYYISLWLLDPAEGVDPQIILDGIDVFKLENVRALAFSKSAVIAAAEALGYTADMYEISLSFVPVGADERHDYSVVFTEKDELYVSGSDTVEFTMNSAEKVNITITPARSGTWTMYSECVFDSCGTLYGADGTALVYDDDGHGNLQFQITYELTAGVTYTLEVRPLGVGSFSGIQAVRVNFVASEAVAA